MSKLETNTIDTVSGTANLTIGDANNTGTTTIKSNNTAAITVDSSQNVGIGTASPGTKLEVVGTGVNGIEIGQQSDGTDSSRLFFTNSTNVCAMRSSGGGLKFSTGATIGSSSGDDRVTIDSVGNLKVSRNGAALNVNSTHQLVDTLANSYSLMLSNKSSSPASQYMLEIGFKSSSPDNGNAKFIEMNDSTTTRCRINSDGDVYNHDGTYGTISDERIKQDIIDASSQWEDIKNIRVRKYKKKDDVLQYGEENAPTEIGVISQELETVSPGLIKEQKPNSSHAELHEDFAGENPQNVKYVKYSILYMKSIKALQESMARIEQLETKNTELEARITALENA